MEISGMSKPVELKAVTPTPESFEEYGLVVEAFPDGDKLCQSTSELVSEMCENTDTHTPINRHKNGSIDGSVEEART
ncbi:hypothetical protein ACFX2F_001154 [Malus domestica]